MKVYAAMRLISTNEDIVKNDYSIQSMLTVAGIFSTEQKAYIFINKQNEKLKNNKLFHIDFSVKEFTVDGEE